MKQVNIAIVIGLMLIVGQTQAQKVIFVRPDAQGDGSSWSQALGSLQQALAQAQAGDQIWVAAGIYRPGNQREASFFIPAGVALYGGFAGNESSLETRDPEAHPTILSGEIGQPGIEDNVYTVVTIGACGPETRLDGFIITLGNAFDKASETDARRCGGGLYIDGSKGAAAPTIVHCVFRENTARVGGAVYLNGQRGQCAPIFEYCTFASNKAGVDGGAIYSDARNNGSAKPVFRFCTFQDNEATYGGAIVNAAGNGQCELRAEQSVFKHNMALAKGGGIYDLHASRRCRTILSDCVFQRNLPDDHSQVFMGYNSTNKQLYRLEKR